MDNPSDVDRVFGAGDNFHLLYNTEFLRWCCRAAFCHFGHGDDHIDTAVIALNTFVNAHKQFVNTNHGILPYASAFIVLYTVTLYDMSALASETIMKNIPLELLRGD